jgi:hypothetical protein
MRSALRSAIRPWVTAIRGIGLLVLLVAGSTALGLAIAWPLWLLATAARRLYTVLVLAAAAGGAVFLAVRAFARGRRRAQDTGQRRRSPTAALISVLIAFLACCGLYSLAALAFQGLWLIALPTMLVWVCLLWLLGRARRAVRRRGEAPVPADIEG